MRPQPWALPSHEKAKIRPTPLLNHFQQCWRSSRLDRPRQMSWASSAECHSADIGLADIGNQFEARQCLSIWAILSGLFSMNPNTFPFGHLLIWARAKHISVQAIDSLVFSDERGRYMLCHCWSLIKCCILSSIISNQALLNLLVGASTRLRFCTETS